MNKRDLEISLIKANEEIKELKLFINNEIIKKLTNGNTTANHKIVTLTYELKKAYETIEQLNKNQNKEGNKQKETNKNKKTTSKIGRTKEYKEFRLRILERDNYKCQECGSSYRLQIHHLKPKSKYPELIMEPSNCITLCITCHSKTDNFFI